MLMNFFSRRKGGRPAVERPVRISADVHTVIDERGVVVFDPRGGRMFKANPIGAEILQMLSQERPPAQVAHDLSRHYSIDPERARADVARFVAELRGAGLLAGGRD
jgi:PqqD family protein of HPr-rel-A system